MEINPVEALRELSSKSEGIEDFFTYITKKDRNFRNGEIKVSSALIIMKRDYDLRASKAEVLEALAAMVKLKLGTLNKETETFRIKSGVDLSEICSQALTGRSAPSALKTIKQMQENLGVKSLAFALQGSPDRVVEVTYPVDLSKAEAESFCRFMLGRIRA